MRPHPWIVALALLLVGVMAFGTTMVSRHREARRLRRLPPEAPEEAPPPPRRWPPQETPAPRPAPAPAPAPAEPIMPTGTLRVSVTGPHGLRISQAHVAESRHADPDDEGDSLDEDVDEAGTFLATELEPGLYDVVVEAPGMRTARIEGVPTNGEPVVMALERAPVLRGSVGRAVEGEDTCAGASVSYKGAEGERVGVAVDVDDCSFAIDDLPPVGPVALFAKAGGRVERALVTLPLTGDPAFLCLAPSCGDPPASVVVYVADGLGALVPSARLEWTLIGDATRGEIGSTTIQGPGVLQRRRSGETLRLLATVEERSAEATVFVGSGVTDVVLTLPAPPSDGPAEQDEEPEVILDDLIDRK